jgi:hypothetical protein
LFSTCLKELVGIDGKVIVECETRLIKTLARSFPEFHFRDVAYYNKPGLPAYHDDYDYQIPVGSLCGIFRKKIEDFDRSGPYIIVDPERAQIYRDRIAEAVSGGAKKRLIGICWRSGVIEPTRNSGYTTLDAWEDVFAIPGIQLVNLQYGKCEEEIQAVEKKFKIKILRWSDLNLQNDLDGVFALMSCLDEVITVATAVNTMAGAVGVPVRAMFSGNQGWPQFGTKRYPFFPLTKCYLPENGQVAIDLLPIIAEDLRNEAA